MAEIAAQAVSTDTKVDTMAYTSWAQALLFLVAFLITFGYRQWNLRNNPSPRKLPWSWARLRPLLRFYFAHFWLALIASLVLATYQLPLIPALATALALSHLIHGVLPYLFWWGSGARELPGETSLRSFRFDGDRIGFSRAVTLGHSLTGTFHFVPAQAANGIPLPQNSGLWVRPWGTFLLLVCVMGICGAISHGTSQWFYPVLALMPPFFLMANTWSLFRSSAEGWLLLVPTVLFLVALEWHSDPTLLHQAAERGEEKVIQFLLDRGVDPNVRDRAGKTPLFHATKAGQSRAEMLLFRRGGRY